MKQLKSTGGMAFRRRGDGIPVVLIHGIPGAGRAWDPVVGLLPAHLDVVVPDLLGFGDSDAPRTMTVETVGAAAQAAAVAQLIDELGMSSVVVVGHDFGLPVSVLLADARPDLVSTMFLMAGNVFGDTPIPFPLSLVNAPLVGPVAARLLFSPPALAVVLRQGVAPGTPPPDRGTYVGSGTQPAAIAAIFSSALRHLAKIYAPVEAAFRQLEMPVAVGWGDRDPFFGVDHARRTAAVLASPLHIFEGAGHFLPHERPAEVAEQIRKITAEVVS